MAAQEELFLDPSGLSEAEERRSLADRQTSILHTATQLGHVEMVRKLIVDYQLRGRSLDQFDSAQFGSSRTPLHLAAVHGHRMAARLLLTAGAEPDVADEDGVTPLLLAADLGHLPLVQLLSLHGAKRSPPGSKLGSAEFMGSHHNDVREWLQRTRSWCSPLHHLELLGVSQVRALLRSGAALRARSGPGAQSPLELARQRADGSPQAAAALDALRRVEGDNVDELKQQQLAVLEGFGLRPAETVLERLKGFACYHDGGKHQAEVLRQMFEGSHDAPAAAAAAAASAAAASAAASAAECSGRSPSPRAPPPL